MRSEARLDGRQCGVCARVASSQPGGRQTRVYDISVAKRPGMLLYSFECKGGGGVALRCVRSAMTSAESARAEVRITPRHCMCSFFSCHVYTC